MSINFENNNNYNNKSLLTVNYVNNCSDKVIKDLSGASDVICNYAKSKKAQIAITPEVGTDYLYLTTSSKKAKVMSSPVNTPFSRYVKSLRYGSRVVSTSIIDGSEKGDKPFLRRVYEKMQYMLEGTEPRVETMKKETLAKLKQIGKIK